MITFHSIDFLIILAYFLVVFSIGLLSGRKQDSSNEEYILLGRRLTLPGFVATLVTTWYGGILGVGEFTFRYGIVNLITQGLFFYIFAAVFGLFFARRVQKLELFTIPDILERSYSRPVALIGSVFTFLMVSPAPYILILGILLKVIFGIGLGKSILIGAVFSTLYLLSGGFKAVVRTDILQFVLMFTGFLILLPAAVFKFGGADFLISSLPDTHLSIPGELNYGYIFAWGFIALWTLIDPGFYQRCLAAKDGKTAKRGIFTAIGFWVIFDLLTCASGLYARAALPEIDPLMSFPLLADLLLPAVLKGIFFTGMIATVMSTIDSFTFLSAVTIGNDLIGRILNKRNSAGAVRRYTQFGLLVSASLAVIIAWWSRSVIDIWYTLGTLGIPALLLPVLCSYSKKPAMSSGSVIVNMISASSVSSAWLLYGYINISGGYPVYPLGIEPMYPGILVSLIIFLYSFSSRNKFG